jgi:hypothetical protein
VTLSARDGIAAALEPADIQLRTVEGTLAETRVAIGPIVAAVDLPPEARDFEFQSAAVTIELRNAAAAAARADLVVTGRSGEREIALPVRASIPAGRPGEPAVTTIVLDPSNSRVLDLIHLYPETAEVGGSIYVGDGSVPVRLRADDYVEGDYVVAAPLRVVLGSTTYTADPFDLELSSEVREQIAGHLAALHLAAQVENHFPVAAEVEIHFAGSEEDLLKRDELVLRTGRVAAGEVDPATGRVRAATVTQVDLRVAEGEVELFTRPRFLGAVVVRLFGGTQAVEFRGDDYLSFRGLATLEVGVQ